MVDPARIRSVNDADRRPEGRYVVYWMIGARRPHWNHSLDHAADLARSHDVPLVVLEALRLGYPWASERLHQFIVEGMIDNARTFSDSPVLYYPYLEPVSGAGRGLLKAIADNAVAVVTDDYPAFFLPAMIEAAGREIPVSLEAVDGNGLLPVRSATKGFTRAYDFRRFLQRNLIPYLDDVPESETPTGVPEAPPGLVDDIAAEWAPMTPGRPVAEVIDGLDLDRSVPAVSTQGGHVAGTGRLASFVADQLSGYLERNHPDDDPSSRLSPYLHFGHVGAHQVFWQVAHQQDWHPGKIGDRRDGGREGWWGMSPAAEGYLDQLVTWRELGLNMCRFESDHESFDAIPEWAQKTLAEHAGDPREHRYSLEELESAATHDEIWNAAQRELLIEGRLHNYLRMLWGKKILEWTDSPRQAFEIMVHLNNKYAIDGRDANSYSGILWVLGKFDRAWGPERPIFGKVRYMSSDNTRRKLRLSGYLAKYSEQGSLFE